MLPGNLVGTGHDVCHPDGRQLQRVGVQPHIAVVCVRQGPHDLIRSVVSRCSWLRALDDRKRVYKLSVLLHLEVKLWANSNTRRACQANRVPLVDAVPFLRIDTAEMGICRLETSAVIDYNEAAVIALPFCNNHPSACGSVDLVSHRGLVVDTSMEFGHLQNGMESHPEAGGHSTIGWWDELGDLRHIVRVERTSGD